MAVNVLNLINFVFVVFVITEKSGASVLTIYLLCGTIVTIISNKYQVIVNSCMLIVVRLLQVVYCRPTI